MEEKDGFMWHFHEGRMQKFCSSEEWKLRTDSVKAISNASTIEEKKALLAKSQKEIRAIHRKTMED